MLEDWGIRAMPHGQAALSPEKEKNPRFAHTKWPAEP